MYLAFVCMLSSLRFSILSSVSTNQVGWKTPLPPFPCSLYAWKLLATFVCWLSRAPITLLCIMSMLLLHTFFSLSLHTYPPTCPSHSFYCDCDISLIIIFSYIVRKKVCIFALSALCWDGGLVIKTIHIFISPPWIQRIIIIFIPERNVDNKIHFSFGLVNTNFACFNTANSIERVIIYFIVAYLTHLIKTKA